jgi:hypothetical protein
VGDLTGGLPLDTEHDGLDGAWMSWAGSAQIG